jgi:hypothetical protein
MGINLCKWWGNTPLSDIDLNRRPQSGIGWRFDLFREDVHSGHGPLIGIQSKTSQSEITIIIETAIHYTSLHLVSTLFKGTGDFDVSKQTTDRHAHTVKKERPNHSQIYSH